MKRSVKLMRLVIFLSLMLAEGVVFVTGTSNPANSQQPPRSCCIAGKYEGFHKDTPSKTCPKPGEGKFIMEINQAENCGSKIWGTVTDPKNPKAKPQKFEGTVTSGEKGCCNIQGKGSRPSRPVATGAPAAPAEETTFKGVLCKKDGKWTGGGGYTNKRGATICNGNWNMTQM